jgi:hypothetical protein
MENTVSFLNRFDKKLNELQIKMICTKEKDTGLNKFLIFFLHHSFFFPCAYMTTINFFSIACLSLIKDILFTCALSLTKFGCLGFMRNLILNFTNFFRLMVLLNSIIWLFLDGKRNTIQKVFFFLYKSSYIILSI